MSDEEIKQLLKDILDELKSDSHEEQLLGDMLRFLEDTFKIHQNIEIKNTERFMEIKNLLTDIKKNQETDNIIELLDNDDDKLTYRIKQDVPKSGPSM